MSKEKNATIPLDFPLELADRKIDSVTMRRPNMGDLVDYPVNATTSLKEEMALVAHLTDLHEDDLRQMDSEDYDKLQTQLLQFRGISFNKRNQA